MCGIVGILGREQVAGQLVDALKRLEYRGYDSAGIATVVGGAIDRRRASGKLVNLEALLRDAPLTGEVGIGHTRWATHGAPTENNAHPHTVGGVSVVHNGIIENFRPLREELTAHGAAFTTDTDTEVIAQLVASELAKGLSPQEAVRAALPRLEGAFALAVIFASDDNLMVAARKGSPLAIGHGDGEMYLGSDAIALAPFTDTISYLDEGDWAVVTREGAQVYDAVGRPVDRQPVKSQASALLVDRGNHRHFMEKEIHEQPEAVSHTLARYLDFSEERARQPDLGIDLAKVTQLTISACGTAYYAGLIAKYWIESIARLPVEIDVASEMRYREAPLPQSGMALFVSQSGETADTLATLRYCRENDQRIVSIVNVQESTIARESHAIFPTLAGPEIGVASTKAFTSQLAVLASFAIALGRARGVLSVEGEAELVRALQSVPGTMAQLLLDETPYIKLAQELSKARDVLYLGRGSSFPLAMEGALKLKEISYIHAEGYAAGELKHGPIALIDENVPVVVVAPKDALFDKTVSNMQEVAARGGQIVLITNADPNEIGCDTLAMLSVPDAHPFVTPLLYSLPIQMLAYHTAVFMGTDVDQPRNLAKSVTVE